MGLLGPAPELVEYSSFYVDSNECAIPWSQILVYANTEERGDTENALFVLGQAKFLHTCELVFTSFSLTIDADLREPMDHVYCAQLHSLTLWGIFKNDCCSLALLLDHVDLPVLKEVVVTNHMSAYQPMPHSYSTIFEALVACIGRRSHSPLAKIAYGGGEFRSSDLIELFHIAPDLEVDIRILGTDGGLDDDVVLELAVVTLLPILQDRWSRSNLRHS